MSAPQIRPVLAGHRDSVTESINEGKPFGDVEDSIDGVDDLTIDEKAGLWLFAFSLRPRSEQQRDAQILLHCL